MSSARSHFFSLRTNASQHPRHRLRVASLTCAALLTVMLPACGGGDDTAESQSLPAGGGSGSPTPVAVTHGRFVGVVTIDGTEHFADALLTIDGALRLYVGGPHSNDGALERTRPATSEQFVGTFAVQESQASGSGIIIGQQCAAGSAPNPYCGHSTPAAIQATFTGNQLEGDIRVDSGTPSTWKLQLGSWDNYYDLRADPLSGQLREELAEFARADDTIVNFDQDGSLFFQSANSGCVGRGRSVPHLDGKFDVYDIAFSLESCTGPYSYLNGSYQGFATSTPSDYWDYDSLLRIWASGSGAAQTAVTMLAEPL